jgi:hypothetical protein
MWYDLLQLSGFRWNWNPNWPGNLKTLLTLQSPEQGACWSEFSRQSGATFHVPTTRTKQEPTYKIVRRDTDNVASQILIQDTHSNMVSNPSSTSSKMQNVIQRNEINVEVDISQPSIYWTSSVHREIYDQFSSVHKWYPLWSTNALVCIVHNIKQYDVVNCAMFADQFRE